MTANRKSIQDKIKEKSIINDTYLVKRFKPFGKLEDISKFKTIDFNTKKEEERTVLSSDENGNLLIHYHNLAGSEWSYHIKGVKYSKKYIRTRLKSPINNVKYISPKGVGLLPFFNGSIINKYQQGEKIKTLFLIEGEIKALIGSFFGLDCVGLGSIHGFHAPKDLNRLYFKELAPEIIELINKCKVENLVYLTDADTISLNYKVDVDMNKRPNSFYSAVKNFRNASKKLVFEDECCLKDFYFAHIKDVYNPESKGLDDLIESNIENSKEIILDLTRLEKSEKYFKFFNLKQKQDVDLYKYFGLTDEHHFYDTYQSFLGTKEFIFKNKKYYFDSENVKLLKDLALDNYMRIGFNYYKLKNQTTNIGTLSSESKVIEPWQKIAICDDHGKNAHKLVKKYDGFINEPNWLNYRRTKDNQYNICLPLAYQPRTGKIANTIRFIQHIADDKSFVSINNDRVTENPQKGNTGTMLLDYLSVMVQYPKHYLSVPCLLSTEQETGKTTFAEYVAKLFEGNSIILRTKDFTGDFNSHWAGKFFVAIDEGDFEDKRTAKDQIKQLTTTNKITLNTKGVAIKQVDSFMKIMVCSNAEQDFLNLDKNDKRFWIIPVKSLEIKDEKLKYEMFKEIPSFFEYLSRREIFHKDSGRMWFDDSLIMNKHWQSIVNESKANWKHEVDDFIVSVFDQYTDIEFFDMPAFNLHMNLKNLNQKFYADKKTVARYLKNEYSLFPTDKTMDYTLYSVSYADGNFLDPERNKKGKPYRFNRKDWIKK